MHVDTQNERLSDDRLNPEALNAAYAAYHAHAADAGRKGSGIEKAIRAYLLTELQQRRAEAKPGDVHIKHMVDRFLGWKLPADFNPDDGIRFEKVGNAGTTYEYTREPTGTNLLDAVQATAMVRYMLGGIDDDGLQLVINRLTEVEKTTGAVPMATSPLPKVPDEGEGWVRVPREPTQEMIGAGLKKNRTNPHPWLPAVYRAMIAAAPSSPATRGVTIPLETLKWWRELVDLNPADLAPRMDAALRSALEER